MVVLTVGSTVVAMDIKLGLLIENNDMNSRDGEVERRLIIITMTNCPSLLSEAMDMEAAVAKDSIPPTVSRVVGPEHRGLYY